MWIHLKYIKLPSFCYQCGILNHDTKQCPFSAAKGPTMFGRWLRADDRTWNIPVWTDIASGSGSARITSMPDCNIPTTLVAGKTQQVTDSETLHQLIKEPTIASVEDMVTTSDLTPVYMEAEFTKKRRTVGEFNGQNF